MLPDVSQVPYKLRLFNQAGSSLILIEDSDGRVMWLATQRNNKTGKLHNIQSVDEECVKICEKNLKKSVEKLSEKKDEKMGEKVSKEKI